MIEKCIIDSLDEHIGKTNNPLLKTARNILNGLVGIDLNWHDFVDYYDNLHFYMHKGTNVLELFIYGDKVDVWYFCTFGDNQIKSERLNHGCFCRCRPMKL